MFQKPCLHNFTLFHYIKISNNSTHCDRFHLLNQVIIEISLNLARTTEITEQMAQQTHEGDST